jgi:hypothetical protein
MDVHQDGLGAGGIHLLFLSKAIAFATDKQAAMIKTTTRDQAFDARHGPWRQSSNTAKTEGMTP